MTLIRPCRPGDLDALHAICLATGLSGADASARYRDPRLPGALWAASYGVLEPGLCLVAEDARGVAGYAAGTLDTAAWERRLERDWWPELRRRHPRRPDEPGFDDAAAIRLIHRPPRVPAEVAARFPAHLHLNLLPRAQGGGLGLRLAEHWLRLAAARGARAAHVGVSAENARGLRFWERAGFRRLEALEGGAVWMGREVPAPLSPPR